MRKFIRRLLKSIVHRLPVRVRNEIVRNAVRLPMTVPEDIVFKIASTTDELEASFKLVYDSYLPVGYCSENKLKMRATVYHALPTTTTLLAIDAGKVVGTLTVVRDNRLGLPLDKIFDIQNLRTNSSRVAEITSLAIHKDYRRERGGQILFPLLRLMYEYTTSYFGVNQLVVTVHPRDVDFYMSLLLFERVPGTGIVDYLGAPAVVLHLDLNLALEKYQRTYSTRRPEHNLFDFFVNKEFPTIKLPAREYNKINDPVVSYDYYQQMFVKKLHIEHISDRRSVEACFRQTDHLRSHFRIEVEAPAVIEGVKFTVMDASRRGFRAFTTEGFSFQSEVEVRIEIGTGIYAHVTAKPVWMSPHRGVGFEITKADENWYSFIVFLYRDHFKTAI